MAVSVASSLALIPLGIFSCYGTSLDIFILFSFGFVRKQDVILDFLDKCIDPATVINIFKFGAALFILLQIFRLYIGLNGSSSSTDGFPAKPIFFPCRTAHTRMFPTKHSFSYSYLLAGIPVGWKGSAGGMLSADLENEPTPWYRRLFSIKPSSAWFTVSGDDYFERGHVKGGLEEKLQNYLHSQVRTVVYGCFHLLTHTRASILQSLSMHTSSQLPVS
jgi:hypothetical protein